MRRLLTVESTNRGGTRGRSPAALISGLVAIAMVRGSCGSDDEESDGTAAESIDTTASADATTPSSPGAPAESADCPLTTEQVTAVIGGDLTDLGCGWSGEYADVFVDSFPGTLWAEYREQADSPAGAVTDVEGLGDDAYEVTDSALFVLVGDEAFSFMVLPTGATDLDAADAERALAALVVG